MFDFYICILGVLLVGSVLPNADADDIYTNEVRIGFNTGFSARRDVRFYLYTAMNREEAHVFSVDTIGTLAKSFYNSSHPVRIIIHGWMNNASSLAVRGIKDAYLGNADFNVIGVDWNIGAFEPYFRASQYTVAVGIVVADLVNHLVRQNLSSICEIYLVGHSLGAHIAGTAGHLIKSDKLSVIYGLDPASINFFEDEPDTRLSPDDADYVEVVHTNTQFSGYPHPIGTVDFYMNYGKKQPGCKSETCSHGRSVEFFIESLGNMTKGFWGVACNDYAELKSKACYNIKQLAAMGNDPARKSNPRGIYIVETTAEPPYALGYIH